MSPLVVPAPDQARGFDCTVMLSDEGAAAFQAHGYAFAVRYVSRADAPNRNDLAAPETERILAAGLGLMAVQHVESELAWVPTEAKGLANGKAAAAGVAAAGLPAGAMVWCDLEGVARSVGCDAVIGYCHAWWDVVHRSGFVPGLYVGYHARLSPEQLYNLPFEHYWAAYNLNADEYPATRGCQMHQWAARGSDRPPGIGFEFDVNTVLADNLGGLPMMVTAGGDT